jgi:hypothetical protein
MMIRPHVLINVDLLQHMCSPVSYSSYWSSCQVLISQSNKSEWCSPIHLSFQSSRFISMHFIWNDDWALKLYRDGALPSCLISLWIQISTVISICHEQLNRNVKLDNSYVETDLRWLLWSKVRSPVIWAVELLQQIPVQVDYLRCTALMHSGNKMISYMSLRQHMSWFQPKILGDVRLTRRIHVAILVLHLRLLGRPWESELRTCIDWQWTSTSGAFALRKTSEENCQTTHLTLLHILFRCPKLLWYLDISLNSFDRRALCCARCTVSISHQEPDRILVLPATGHIHRLVG